MYGRGEGLAVGLTAAWRRADAFKYLLQPGISVKNLGPGHDYCQQFFARLEVWKDKQLLATIQATPDSIEDILNRLPPARSDLRTALCRARGEVACYQEMEIARQDAAIDDLVKKAKSAVKWLFPRSK